MTEDYEMKQTSTTEEKNSCKVTWTCFFGASVACHMSINTGH